MPSCEVFSQHFNFAFSEVDTDFYSTFIANCVFNNFLSYTAITLNVLTIHAIRKTSSLPMPLRTLLLSLSVSDVGVGLVGQPLYTSLLVDGIQGNITDCNTSKAFDILVVLFSVASFFTVVTLSVDRFLAIHLHLRYQELVNHKRVVAVVISIWVISPFLSLMALWIPPDTRTLFVCIGDVIGLVVTAVAYIRIYLAVRRHKNQIQVLQVQQVARNDEMANFASLVKSAVGTFYVYLVFLICCLPIFICFAALEMYGPSIALQRLLLFSVTLIFLNSSLNPVIYCWKMRHIRHTIMDILRNMSWVRNRAPH
ncbi:adenosine receptor A2b-like [Oculina patagonica]